MKSLVFAKRVAKEIVRDPLSFIFCLGFPIVMLIIMSIVDSSIPEQAEMSLFHINNLAPGMCYFGLTFIMLFTCIQVSKDRSSALLLRLYASPLKSLDYVVGYTVPVCVLGIIQIAVCFVAALIVGQICGETLPITSILLSAVLLFPSLLMFTGLGILFGSAASEKSAPGLCSIVISLVGMIGGIWMDVDSLGGPIRDVSRVLPFYHGVRLARLPFADKSGNPVLNLIITTLSGIVVYLLAISIFTSKMKKDKR